MINQSGKRSRRLSALDKYCIFTISFFTIYTIAELTLSSITGTTNDRLTEAVQWFAAGELFLLAMIKRLKLRNEKEDQAKSADQKEGMGE